MKVADEQWQAMLPPTPVEWIERQGTQARFYKFSQADGAVSIFTIPATMLTNTTHLEHTCRDLVAKFGAQMYFRMAEQGGRPQCEFGFLSQDQLGALFHFGRGIMLASGDYLFGIAMTRTENQSMGKAFVQSFVVVSRQSHERG